MGVCTDILVAHASEAETLGSLPYPLGDGRWTGIDAKGFDQISLSELLAVLTGAPWRDEMVDEFYPELYTCGDDGPWIYQVPDRLTRLLAELPETRLEEVAQAWVEQESFPGKLWIQREHSRPKSNFLARLFGRGGSAAVEEETLDFTPLIPTARETLAQLRSLATEAQETAKDLLLWMSL